MFIIPDYSSQSDTRFIIMTDYDCVKVYFQFVTCRSLHKESCFREKLTLTEQ